MKLVPFKKKLKSFFYNRLSSVFNHDDIRLFICSMDADILS